MWHQDCLAGATFGRREDAGGREDHRLVVRSSPKADLLHVVSLLGQKATDFSEFSYYPSQRSQRGAPRRSRSGLRNDTIDGSLFTSFEPSIGEEFQEIFLRPGFVGFLTASMAGTRPWLSTWQELKKRREYARRSAADGQHMIVGCKLTTDGAGTAHSEASGSDAK